MSLGVQLERGYCSTERTVDFERVIASMYIRTRRSAARCKVGA